MAADFHGQAGIGEIQGETACDKRVRAAGVFELLRKLRSMDGMQGE